MAALPNSILDDTKKLLGLHADDPSYDIDVMIHINSTFSILHQLGVGPVDGFEITDKNQLWADFLGTNNSRSILVDFWHPYLSHFTSFADLPICAGKGAFSLPSPALTER